MRNRWDDNEASRCCNDLELRVYTSRLPGREPALVLHGGGSTSVQTSLRNRAGSGHPPAGQVPALTDRIARLCERRGAKVHFE